MSPPNRLIHQESIAAAHGARLADCGSCGAGERGAALGWGEVLETRAQTSREKVRSCSDPSGSTGLFLSSPSVLRFVQCDAALGAKGSPAWSFFRAWISLQLCVRLLAGEALWDWILSLWGQEGDCVKAAPSCLCRAAEPALQAGDGASGCSEPLALRSQWELIGNCQGKNAHSGSCRAVLKAGLLLNTN